MRLAIYRNTVTRLAASLCCLVLVTVMNFLLPRLLPGDPVLMLTGMDDAAVTAQQYDQYRAALGLTEPLSVQFVGYLGDLLRGNLGWSYHLNAPVATLIADRLPTTLLIALPAIVFSALLAVWLGCRCGCAPDGRLDRTVGPLMVLLDAIPGFLLALLAVWLFGFRLGWLPLGGLSATQPPTGAAWLWDRLLHLVLPVAVLTLAGLPGKYLLVRSAVADQLQRPYATYAVARGATPAQLRYRHIFPNACQPFVAMLGVSLGFLLSGSMVVESIFSLRGMGGLLQQAVTLRDLPTMQGCLLVTALAVIAATLLCDLALLLLDPKARCGVYES